MPGIGPGNIPPRPPLGKTVDKKSTPEKDPKLEIDETVSDLPIRPNPVGNSPHLEPLPCPDKILITDSHIPTNISLMRVWLVNNNVQIQPTQPPNY